MFNFIDMFLNELYINTFKWCRQHRRTLRLLDIILWTLSNILSGYIWSDIYIIYSYILSYFL